MKNIYNKKKSNKYLSLILGMAIFGFMLNSLFLNAHRAGVANQNAQNVIGCGDGTGSCHGTSATTSTTLSASSASGSFTCTVGDTMTFSITVQQTSRSYAGINIAVKTNATANPGTNAGTLLPTPDSYLYIYSGSGELTHSSPKPYSGGQVTFTFEWIAPSTAGTYYLRACANAVNNNLINDTGDLWNWLSPVTITVQSSASITVTSPNGSEDWCPGSSHNITWNSSNVSSVNILLSTDGGSSFSTTLASSVTASSGSWSWSIPMSLASTSNCKIKVVSSASSSTFGVSSSSFQIGAANSILTQPVSQTVCVGSGMLLSVLASASGVTYQWYKNNAPISGATQSTYSINFVSSSDAGSYTVKVVSPCGDTIASQSAVLTVDAVPVITQQPLPVNVCKGAEAIFNVTATGTSLTYQWRKNGTNISGATGTTYLILITDISDAGIYDVKIMCPCNDTVISNTVALNIGTPPQITVDLVSQTLCEDSTARFFVHTNGTNEQFVWTKDGSIIQNAKDSIFVINQVKPNDSGQYQVTVIGTCSPVANSQTAVLTVNPKPVITQQPHSQTIFVGQTASFVVQASGGNVSYQWEKNGTNLPGVTQNQFQITNAQLSDSGNYICNITNSCGSIASDSVKLKVLVNQGGPTIGLLSDDVNFGKVLVQTTKDTTLNKFIYNFGDSTLRIDSVKFLPGSSHSTDSMYFKLKFPSFPISVNAGDSISINADFSPTKNASVAANYQIFNNANNNIVISLLGSGGTINLKSNVDTVDFGETKVNVPVDTIIIISNTGDFAGNKSDLKITSTANVFSMLSPTDSFNIIQPLKQYPMRIRFLSNVGGDYTGEINFTPVENTSSIKVILKGKVQVTSVPGSIDEANSFVIYPNPANDNVTIKIKNSLIGTLKLSITDVYGNTLFSDELNNINGDEFSYNWNVKTQNGITCPSGVYEIKIENGSSIYSKCLIIIR